MKQILKYIFLTFLIIAMPSYVCAIDSDSYEEEKMQESSYEIIQDFVEKCYILLDLDGVSEIEIKNTTDSLVNRECSVFDFTYDLFFEDEVYGTSLGDEEYIFLIYNVFLGREPSEYEITFWTDKYNETGSMMDVFGGIVNSEEFRNFCDNNNIIQGFYDETNGTILDFKYISFVDKTYTVCFDKICGNEDLIILTGTLLAGDCTSVDFVLDLLLSEEYTSMEYSFFETASKVCRLIKI